MTDALQVPEEARMVVSLDVRRLNAIEWIDAENQAACVEAGILGGRLQELLAEQGFTSGHSRTAWSCPRSVVGSPPTPPE